VLEVYLNIFKTSEGISVNSILERVICILKSCRSNPNPAVLLLVRTIILMLRDCNILDDNNSCYRKNEDKEESIKES
jgi:hypothetical protein